MAEQDTPPPTITAMKIPIIKKGEYDIWSMRMRQYICHTDHNLWDVIVNGDLEEEAAPSGEQSAPPAPKTAKQLAAKRNQERVKSILLLAIPDEYLLKFHNVPDAKSLWAAIKSRFGGNEESKKMQKNVLKHQFENFTTASNESLDKAYDRFQKLISQLEVHGAPVSKEDINQKFLRSLPPSWSQIALIMRNKPDIDQVDIDDLYNNLRVYEDEMKKTCLKREQVLSSFHWFLKLSNPPSPIIDSPHGSFSHQIMVLNFRHLTDMSIFTEPLSETVPRSLSLSCRRNATTNEPSSQALVAQDGLGGYDWSNDFDIEPVNYALMAISSSSSSSYSDNEGYELALESLESKILGHEKNELAWGEKYEFQNYELKCRELKIDNLKMELEKVVKEKDELKVKIEKWEESSKGLNKLLNSQMSAKDKNGLGYDTQLDEISNKSETDSEISMSVFKVRSSDEKTTPINDRFSKSDGYHVVPPPITGNFLTLRADISFADLDEYAIRKKIIESITTEPEANTSKSKTSKTIVIEGSATEPVIIKEEEIEKPVKKRGKIKKQKARKGIHVDKTAQDETEEEREAFMKDKVTSASSESEIGIDAIPTATKPHTILKDFSRDDLTEFCRLVIKKYGANRPEEMYEKVLLGDLKTMFDSPLSDDAIWGLPLQQKMINWRYYPSCAVHCLTLEASTIYILADRKYPLLKDACQVMLKMKLLDGTMDEVCYNLLKMIEKQAGLRL
ncbi:hypothetical protein Tco_0236616 [Tanacetum coccineum]